MAFSAQTVGQKSLNECLPPDVHFWGAIYGFIHPDSGTEVLTDIYPPRGVSGPLRGAKDVSLLTLVFRRWYKKKIKIREGRKRKGIQGP